MSPAPDKNAGDKNPADKKSEDSYSITDLAREFDITTRAIRFYEDQGLIRPERRGQARIYTPRDRTRLKLILRGKRLGFSLEDVGEIINLYDGAPGEVGQLNLFLEKIDARRALLDAQRADIDVTLEELKVVEDRCRKRLKELKAKR